MNVAPLRFTFLIGFWLAAHSLSAAGEWPQILGPSRTGIAAADETLAEVWPSGGPPVLWQRDVGRGYAGIVIADGRGVVFHRVADQEVVEAFDPDTGKTLWTDGHPTTFQPQVGGGDGPLCTPLIHAGRVITYGAQGVLSCHDAATGKLLWRRDTHQDFAAPEGYFGAGSSPLVVGNVVVVKVGGSRQEAGVVGFALDSGETLWTATSEPASYSSPVAVDIAGEPHVVMITRYKCLLLEPQTGAIRWEFRFGMRGPTVNAAVPVVRTDPAGHALLVTAAYGIGAVEGAFTRDTFTKRWDGVDALASQYCTPIAIGPHAAAGPQPQHAYCIDGRDDVPPATLKCVEMATGRVLWAEKNFGYGTLLAADGKLLAAKTDGDLLLMRVSPEGVTILARHQPLPGTVRALPALADGRLYVRDDDTLVCLNIAPVPKF
jgi:outer membrane protein assembly factor BamB